MRRALFEEARDFAAADWERLRPDSREKLLQRSRLSKYYSTIRWGLLPPTVKKELAMTLLEKQKK